MRAFWPINWSSAWSRTGWPSIARIRPQRLGDASRRLILPEKFTDSALRGEKTVVKLERKDEGLANDFDQFRVARAVYAVLADLVVCAVAGGKPDAAAFDRLHKTPHAVTLDVQQAGQRKQPPTGFEQAVPGIMIMFIMLSLLSGGSVSLIIERNKDSSNAWPRRRFRPGSCWRASGPAAWSWGLRRSSLR